MTRFVYAILTFLLLAVSLPTIILPPKDRVLHSARFREVPPVAKHPTCPVEIVEIRNLNPRKEFFWHDVEIVVRNRTPEPIANLSVSLYVRSTNVNFIIPFKLNGRRSPVIPPGVVCLAPLPPEECRLLEPGATTVLFCSMARNLDQRVQRDFDTSRQAFFEVNQVNFDSIHWDYLGRFQKEIQKSPQLVVDEEFTNRMFTILNVPANWEKSRKYWEDYLSVVQ